METPATDRAIEWLRNVPSPLSEVLVRMADAFASLPPVYKTAMVSGFLRSIEQHAFGPDQSRAARAEAAEAGQEAWAALWQGVRECRAEIEQEKRAAFEDERGRIMRGERDADL